MTVRRLGYLEEEPLFTNRKRSSHQGKEQWRGHIEIMKVCPQKHCQKRQARQCGSRYLPNSCPYSSENSRATVRRALHGHSAMVLAWPPKGPLWAEDGVWVQQGHGHWASAGGRSPPRPRHSWARMTTSRVCDSSLQGSKIHKTNPRWWRRKPRW